MSYRNSSLRMWAAMLILAGAGSLCATTLRAQDAGAAAAGAPAAVSATVPPAGAAEATPAPSASAPAGPRIVPPLERYETPLPGSRSEAAAPVASGSSHTIVLSTLALVLVVIIVVLLAVK